MINPHEVTTLFTRLHSNDGSKVMCGSMSCGNQLTQIEESAGERILIFGPGWVKDHRGTIRFTKHARRRTERGTSPQPRRTPGWKAVQREQEIRASMGLDPEPFPDWDGLLPTDRRLPNKLVIGEFPALIYCPKCRRPQILDKERLQVTYTHPKTV